MRASGVFANVAADGAGSLAGGIGRVEISPRIDGHRNVEVHHARLDHRALIGQIDFDNAIHARERNDDSARARDRSAGKASAGAASDHRHSTLMREFHDGDNLFGRLRKHDQIGPGLIDAAVVFVERQVFGFVKIPARAEDFFYGRTGATSRLQHAPDAREKLGVHPVLIADHFLDHLPVSINEIRLGNLERAVAGADVGVGIARRFRTEPDSEPEICDTELRCDRC